MIRPKGGWRRWVARMMRAFPASGIVLQTVVRAVQPRFNVGVVGVLLDAQGERVLVCEHLFHPVYPWGLPGGWINRGEDPAQTIERELREEVGLRVRAVRPLIVQRGGERGLMDVVFLCALEDGDQAVRLNRELLDYRWVAPADLDDFPRLAKMHYAAISAAFREHAAFGERAAFGGDSQTASESGGA